MSYQRGEVRLKPDYIRAVEALPGKLEAKLAKGPGAWTVKAWQKLDSKGRVDYHYGMMPAPVLADMLKLATMECNCQRGQARELAMERSGYNAIVEEMKIRGIAV